ncbi:hypothetical protein [Paractinoplanes maris]|uniref:hypothetical protein n=1 Tax=Paractinoplanes maris TaxID=1734446 RepID=UPI0020229023|nr:hypothetical protein [Actinoplanes maris]
MSAQCASRTAWWRRWAGLPVVVALFFATSVIAATPQTARATEPVPVPSVLQAVIVSPPHAMGQRPDLRVTDHGGHGRVAPDLTVFAWLSDRAGTRTTAWWHLRRDGDGHWARTGRETAQVRGPPGRRAADASS